MCLAGQPGAQAAGDLTDSNGVSQGWVPCGRFPFWFSLLWMDEILHHFETMGNHLFVDIDRGIIILGLLRWCRISSTHSIN